MLHAHIAAIMPKIQCRTSFLGRYGRWIVIPGGLFSIHLLHYIKTTKKGHSADLPSHLCVFRVKIDFMQQAAGLHKLTTTTWVQGETGDQNAQESARWRLDKLGFFHKSVLFIRLPWTTEVRRVCESSLPLSPSQEIYHLYTEGTYSIQYVQNRAFIT